VSTVRKILSNNLSDLMHESPTYKSAPSLQAATAKCGVKVGRSTIDRALKGTTTINLDYIESIAKVFRLEPWQMIHPTRGGKDDAPDAHVLPLIPAWPFAISPHRLAVLDHGDLNYVNGVMEALVNARVRDKEKRNRKKVA